MLFSNTRTKVEMKPVTFILIILTACGVNVKQTCSFIMENMDTYKDRIELDSPSSSMGIGSSGILKSHAVFSYTSGRNKTLILSAPQGYSIFATVRLFDLRPNEQDSLTLFANMTAGSATYKNYNSYRMRNYYPDENTDTFYAPDGQLGVTFVTGPGSTLGYDGFELLFTVQANFSRCSFDDFRCSNGRCISRLYKCDGHNHCGDRSDQRNCGSFPEPIRPNNGRVAGIVCGILFLLIAVICAIYIMIRRAQRGKTVTRTVVNQHPPPPNVPGYPPPYPEPGMTYPPPPPPYSPYQGISNPGYK